VITVAIILAIALYKKKRKTKPKKKEDRRKEKPIIKRITPEMAKNWEIIVEQNSIKLMEETVKTGDSIEE
jgi:hypothetical protein